MKWNAGQHSIMASRIFQSPKTFWLYYLVRGCSAFPDKELKEWACPWGVCQQHLFQEICSRIHVGISQGESQSSLKATKQHNGTTGGMNSLRLLDTVSWPNCCPACILCMVSRNPCLYWGRRWQNCHHLASTKKWQWLKNELSYYENYLNCFFHALLALAPYIPVWLLFMASQQRWFQAYSLSLTGRRGAVSHRWQKHVHIQQHRSPADVGGKFSPSRGDLYSILSLSPVLSWCSAVTELWSQRCKISWGEHDAAQSSLP